MSAQATGEYALRGDYHRNPSPDWEFYPTYLTRLIRKHPARLRRP